MESPEYRGAAADEGSRAASGETDSSDPDFTLTLPRPQQLAAAGAETDETSYVRLIRANGNQVWSAKLASALNQDNEQSPEMMPGDRIVIGPSPFSR